MKEWFIQSPTVRSQRKTFAIVERTTDELGVQKNRTLKDTRIDAINLSLASGEHGTVYLRDRLKALVRELKGQTTPLKISPNFSENLRIFERFWKEEYEHRRNVDIISAKNEFLRGLRALGNLSLMSASDKDIQKQLNKNYSGDKHRRLVSAIKTLAKYVNRTLKLTPDAREHKEVKYASEEELKQILPHCHNEDFKLLCEAAFYSGCRIGELFALDSLSLRGRILAVNWQLTMTLKKTLPKRGKQRRAYVIPGGEKIVAAWCALSYERKIAIRKIDHGRHFKKACQKAFPSTATKHLRFHDIRHSYAIRLASQNVDISRIARYLGNLVSVCEEYYIGYVANDADFIATDILFGVK